MRTAAMGLVVGWMAACFGGKIPPDALIMEHRGRALLPEGFDPGGVALTPEGRMLVWDSAEPRALLFDTTTTFSAVSLPWHAAFTRIWWSDSAGAWRGLSIARPAVVEMSADLQFLNSVDLGEWAETVTILDAGESAGQIWLASRDDSGDVHLNPISPAGERLPSVHTLAGRTIPHDTAARLSVHLSVLEGRLIANELWLPFDAIQVAPGRPEQRSHVLTQLAHEPSLGREVQRSLSTEPWAALPAVPLDSGWLMTIADLMGDRRVLVRFDRHGTLVAAKKLDAAIGIVASEPSRRLLIAVERDLGGATIHWYGWRWAPSA